MRKPSEAQRSKEQRGLAMRTVLTEVLKAGLTMVAGWTVAGGLLTVLIGLLALVA
jgi:hypothetical protein